MNLTPQSIIEPETEVKSVVEYYTAAKEEDDVISTLKTATPNNTNTTPDSTLFTKRYHS